MTHYDTIVIGGGPAGLAAAYPLKAAGQTVLVVENDLWGGTCPNRGCDPKKMLYTSVAAQDLTQQMQQHGLTGLPQVDWPALMAFKNTYTDKVPNNTLAGLKATGIDTAAGTAQFQDERTLTVGTTDYTADQFVIATGQQPALLPMKGQQYLKTSNDFLDLKTLPKRITFIGAGYIAIELANIAATAGAQVHIVQHNDRLLRQFPQTYTQKLAELLTQQKQIQFDYNVEIETITSEADGYHLQGTNGYQATTDLVIDATGRTPNVTALQLGNAGVTTDRHGVVVNDHLQSSNSRVYAVGDVVSKSQPKLTPVASFEGGYLGQLLTGQTTATIAYPTIPTIVYASPKLAMAGVSLETAQQNPAHYQVTTQDVTSWFTYMRIREPYAQVSTITDQQTGLLVGAVVLSESADRLINDFVVMIDQKTPAAQISKRIMTYPTVESDLSYFY